jgi:tripartite-type tricarboxylate transporter receptor subunit TctC
MVFSRRRFLFLAVTAMGLDGALNIASADTYPARPVRLIVQTPAGGSPDMIGRIMAQWLSERLGQPFVVENRAGASGNIATEAVLRAPADGYSLLLAMSANAINAAVYDDLRFNFIKEAEPVASIGKIPLVMEVNPSIPARTVPEFIAYAKANPGKINMAASGTGSPLHVAGELFKMLAGLNLTVVPYRGEAVALPELISGQVHVMFGVLPASLGYIRAGTLRALAVTSTQRQQLVPDVPPLSEFLPGYEANGWYGIVAPKGTPPEIVDKLNKEIDAGLRDEKTSRRFVDLGCDIFAGPPAAFGKFIADETEKWSKVVRAANIRGE